MKRPQKSVKKASAVEASGGTLQEKSSPLKRTTRNAPRQPRANRGVMHAKYKPPTTSTSRARPPRKRAAPISNSSNSSEADEKLAQNRIKKRSHSVEDDLDRQGANDLMGDQDSDDLSIGPVERRQRKTPDKAAQPRRVAEEPEEDKLCKPYHIVFDIGMHGTAVAAANFGTPPQSLDVNH